MTLSLFCGKVMQTVEKEQVVSVQLLSESRRGWECGSRSWDEWAFEGALKEVGFLQ